MPRSLGSAAVLAIGMVVFAPPMAQTAASYPEQPVRLVVPLSRGGALDVVPGCWDKRSATPRGRPVLIDNRVGPAASTGSSTVVGRDDRPAGYG